MGRNRRDVEERKDRRIDAPRDRHAHGDVVTIHSFEANGVVVAVLITQHGQVLKGDIIDIPLRQRPKEEEGSPLGVGLFHDSAPCDA